MNSPLRRLLADYGMVGVLLILCTVFSVLTIRPQPISGEGGGAGLAEELLSRHPGGRFVVIAGSGAEEAAFVRGFEGTVSRGNGRVVTAVAGEPRAGRRTLTAAAQESPVPDAIAVSPAARQWILFDTLAADFPALKDVPLVAPESRSWPDFLKVGNLLNIANQIVVVAVIALGMTMVIITGGIDLSVGSVIALSAVVTGLLIEQYLGAEKAGAGAMVLAAVGGLACAAAIGLINGLLVTRLELRPFIVTLGTMRIASGLAYTATEGEEMHHLPASFTWLGRGTQWGIPNSVLLLLALYIVAHLLMSRTILGRHLYAVGGNAVAARLSGIRTGRAVLFAYVVCSLLAGLGGVIMASELKSGSPRYGNSYELYVIVAVVIGGTSLSGGQGTMFGTLIGALIIAVLRNGMNLLHVESYTQNVVFGSVILGAVILDRFKDRWLRSG